MGGKKYILDQAVAARKMRRMALEILEQNTEEAGIILVGIEGSGAVVARNILQMIEQEGTLPVQFISLSLDKRRPAEVTLSETPDFTDKVIIVVDDVANSGKTLLYALKPFLNYYPRKIQTLVLVGRRHNSFPVYPDYVGLELATTLQEHIYVEVEGAEVKGAYME
ncbi:MAG: phosphoribosyltransferase [Sphingobacteriales bacterium SCN 48-20]|uniref:phosphoribosyltransferase family protein n=1 Tax=Terrimonas ferruginea TaxID=249 RepID=UPI00086CA0E2|nr:phosphoribosyltransferase family protein [Terrimonas ferruginea]MBN8782827.1 phosphoribosyltransferase [Terrimonas ferruginea]ODT92807.1 MAG: phosphoribosyltransferase [Sphingobacteriales bacterium SCN 48-20]OJW44023.1 MAG: phosphoribosyltransferase [Sphingobacteriales bacterium 48-107]